MKQYVFSGVYFDTKLNKKRFFNIVKVCFPDDLVSEYRSLLSWYSSLPGVIDLEIRVFEVTGTTQIFLD